MAGPPPSAAPSPLAGLRDRLIAWCGISSASDHPAGLEQMLGALRDAFAPLGGDEDVIRDAPGRPGVLRLRRRPGAPVQALLVGHYDTVYDPDDPLRECTLLDPDTLRGPGAADMKGGLVVMLAVLEAIEAGPYADSLGWEVLLTHDEEVGSPRSRPLVEEAAARHDVGLVFEPALPGGRLVRRRLGTGLVTVSARGRAAHAGRNPEDGRNAIVALAEVLAALPALAAELGVRLNVGAVAGGGPANVVPDRARAEVDMRVTRAEDWQAATGRLRELAADVGARHEVAVEVTAGPQRPPRDVDAATEELFAAYRACARSLGVEVGWGDSGGGSDGSFLSAAGLPCLDGVGVVGGALHSPDEWCLLPSLVERAAVAARLLEGLATGDVRLPARR
jgi:glutamate carboxypeptidase